MCGYVGRKHKVPEEEIHHWGAFKDLLRLPGSQYYNRQNVAHLVTIANGTPNTSNAIWWYALKYENEKVKINDKVTSFNARRLNAPLWEDAVRSRRGILFATEIGESNDNKRYLLQAEQVFALGCLYKDWEFNGAAARSFAVITTAPTPEFSQYHAKSMPLFLPNDPAFLNEWLDPSIELSPEISKVLKTPTLRVDLKVTPVKTYKRGEPLGLTSQLLGSGTP